MSLAGSVFYSQFHLERGHATRVVCAPVCVHIRLERSNILQEARSHADERWVLLIDEAAGFNLFEGLAEVLNA